ncbi:hypothetical protein C7C56_014210 [Massilia glaciei]|uniref:Type II secretion system protein n=2 Tax=Massilia glaciei TaxID=1524097 RepID=A0A2U2HJY1_9BURK|nr:hypothetical protein C7C56_014210 [Massilia glaciei]
MNRRRRQRGAALLILVTLAGLGAATLLMGTFGRANPDAARERRTLRALAQAKEALIGHALAHGRLPRPAASAIDGRENPLPCNDEQSCTGLLPGVTLGVDPVDGWGKLLRYSVTPGFANAAIQGGAPAPSKTVLDRDSRGMPYYVAGEAACGPDSQCVPAVLFSSGKNNLGTSVEGILQANSSGSNTDEMHNQRAGRHFMRRAASGDPRLPGGEFDDMLTWIPLPVLLDRMRAARALR